MTDANACHERGTLSQRSYCAALRATYVLLVCALGSRFPTPALLETTARTGGSLLRLTPEGLAAGGFTGAPERPPIGTIKRSPSRTSGLLSLFAVSRLVAGRWYFFT